MPVPARHPAPVPAPPPVPVPAPLPVPRGLAVGEKLHPPALAPRPGEFRRRCGRWLVRRRHRRNFYGGRLGCRGGRRWRGTGDVARRAAQRVERHRIGRGGGFPDEFPIRQIGRRIGRRGRVRRGRRRAVGRRFGRRFMNCGCRLGGRGPRAVGLEAEDDLVLAEVQIHFGPGEPAGVAGAALDVPPVLGDLACRDLVDGLAGRTGQAHSAPRLAAVARRPCRDGGRIRVRPF